MNYIFLIDDEKVFNIINARILKQAGYDDVIITFDNAINALDKIKELIVTSPDELPDAIFLDLQMPEMGGWEFLDQFEKLLLPNKCLVYILSYTINEESVIKAKDYRSVRELINKPLTTDKLKGLFHCSEYVHPE